MDINWYININISYLGILTHPSCTKLLSLSSPLEAKESLKCCASSLGRPQEAGTPGQQCLWATTPQWLQRYPNLPRATLERHPEHRPPCTIMHFSNLWKKQTNDNDQKKKKKKKKMTCIANKTIIVTKCRESAVVTKLLLLFNQPIRMGKMKGIASTKGSYNADNNYCLR